MSPQVPFGTSAATEAEVYKAIQRDPLTLHSRVWAGISASAKELVLGLLEKNAAKRYTLDQVRRSGGGMCTGASRASSDAAAHHRRRAGTTHTLPGAGASVGARRCRPGLTAGRISARIACQLLSTQRSAVSCAAGSQRSSRALVVNTAGTIVLADTHRPPLVSTAQP